MIVVDASVALALVVDFGPFASQEVKARVPRGRRGAHAPHLVDAEVGQALRRFTLRGVIASAAAATALADFSRLPIRRYPHGPLLARAFQLRDNATIYDALYLALAEALEAPLLTGDAALARVPGVRAEVRVVPGAG